jgi:hypothetical protein
MRIENMITAAIIATLPPSLLAQSSEFLSLGAFSHHFDRNAHLNERHPGIGYERDYGEHASWAVGVFKNSLRRAAFYAVAGYSIWESDEHWRLGTAACLSTGYRHTTLAPLLFPFIEWRGKYFAIETLLIPTVKPDIEGAFVVAIKWRLK